MAGKALWEDKEEDARSHEPCHNFGKGLTKGLREARMAAEAAYLNKLSRSGAPSPAIPPPPFCHLVGMRSFRVVCGG